MTSTTTSLAHASSITGEWRTFGGFIRRPTLPDKATGFSTEALVAVLRLYALDLALMGALIGVLLIAMAMGFEMPANSLNDLELTLYWVAIIVLGAPLLEEIAFRSWLSGRPGHILSGLLAAGAVLTIPFLRDAGSNGIIMGVAGLFALVGLIGAINHAGRNRGPFGWFNWAFPGIFWVITLGFGAVHLSNYEEGTGLTMLPLVLPQVIAGALFGFARVRYGLWAAILLHALHNATFLGIFALGKGVG
ncbi:CPBP family glutamic-type intramembrane protease [Erythrobacter sp. HA6-11]